MDMMLNDGDPVVIYNNLQKVNLRHDAVSKCLTRAQNKAPLWALRGCDGPLLDV